MRIISGKFKGRRIEVPGKITARPTTDFAKEGLFNLLNNRIEFEGLEVLDLFAGTGSIGIEFVSRGATSVVSVEIDKKHCSNIRQVCSILGVNNLMLMQTDVFRFITSAKYSYNLIFADPPYVLTNLRDIPDMILAAGLLKDEGLLVLEHSSKNDFSQHLRFSSHRNYGNVHFSFFE